MQNRGTGACDHHLPVSFPNPMPLLMLGFFYQAQTLSHFACNRTY
jgi:hypothetical protein